MNIFVEFSEQKDKFFCVYQNETFWGDSESEVLLEIALHIDPYLFVR